MTALAWMYRQHPDELVASVRGKFSVSLWDAGVGYPLGELLSLVRILSDDPSTPLGAALAGWGYPAPIVDLMRLAAAVSKEQFEKIAPWNISGTPPQPAASEEEIAAAAADLDDLVEFAHM